MKILATLMATALTVLTTQAPLSAADGYQRLYTQWKGKGLPLDIINGGKLNDYAQLTKAGDFSGQNWKITKDGASSRLTTEFRGAKMCLDVTNGGTLNNFVQLQPCGDFSGQLWNIKTVEDGWMTLTTEFRGAKMCLDIENGGARDGMAHLAKCEDVSGQFWKFN